MSATDPLRTIEAAAALPDAHRRLNVLLLIVFVDLLGFGILIPLIPFYATRLGLEPGWVTLIIALHSLAQFVCAPVLGRLSDRYGRRPVLAVSMAGHAVAYGMLAFADSVPLLIVSRLLSGATSANLSAAYAYVADIMPGKHRAQGLARVSAAFALGFALGPAVGGLLAGGVNPADADLVKPAIAAGALSLVALAGIVLFLPETRPAGAAGSTGGAPADATTADPAAAARAAPAPARRALLRDPALAMMVALALIVLVFASMRESLLSLWLHDRLRLDTHDIGVVFTANGITVAIVQFWLTGRLAHRFGEMTTLRAGIVCYGLSWIGLVLATGLPMVLAAIVLGALGTAFFGTSLQSLVSMRSSPDTRGAVMGLYQSSSSLSRFMGAAFSGSLYAGLGQNVPFVLGALMMVPALFVTLRIATLIAADRREVR